MEKIKEIRSRLTQCVKDKGTLKPRCIIILMLIWGLIFAGAYTCKYFWRNYAVSRASVLLLYPEIANGQYPDGTRFTYYDLVSDEKINKALDIMRQKDKYKDYKLKDILANLKVYSKLEESIKDRVEYQNKSGNKYSYVANEYKILFAQPHDKYSKNVLKRIFTPNYSTEFMQELMEVNQTEFAETYGGIGGFRKMIALDDESDYDYLERVEMYDTKINSAIDYLNYVNKRAGGFRSEKYNRSIADSIGELKLLSKNQLNSISSFILSSGVTKDYDVTINKLNTNLEVNTVKYQKANDLAGINEYAQNAYDHTFTENLIVVAMSDSDGLYQARPKTAFDKVVDSKNKARQKAAEYGAKINSTNRNIGGFTAAQEQTEEYSRLCTKCEELLKDFEGQYSGIVADAEKVLDEYFQTKNSGFFDYRVEKRNPFSAKYFMKLLVSFITGMIAVLITVIIERYIKRRIASRKRRKEIMRLWNL